mmetsp:Transcript_117664/g.344585  ORF Transcript_117664/g.344585 Transcript_117664/m.344585 type:complete len:211 (+) Transcript_117664:473-1105(+)
MTPPTKAWRSMPHCCTPTAKRCPWYSQRSQQDLPAAKHAWHHWRPLKADNCLKLTVGSCEIGVPLPRCSLVCWLLMEHSFGGHRRKADRVWLGRYRRAAHVPASRSAPERTLRLLLPRRWPICQPLGSSPRQRAMEGCRRRRTACVKQTSWRTPAIRPRIQLHWCRRSICQAFPQSNHPLSRATSVTEHRETVQSLKESLRLQDPNRLER